MQGADADRARSRLRRLQGYLQETPDNPALLGEVCDAAIACGEFRSAQGYVEKAAQLQLDPVAWGFRDARVALATRDLDKAVQVLEALRARVGDHPTVVHDLAYARMLAGDHAGSRSLTEPWIGGASQTARAVDATLEAFQTLWLRACHHQQALDDAMAWAKAQAAAGTLMPRSKGVACLIALDADDVATAGEWARAALQQRPGMPEPHVVQGMLALAASEVASATREFSIALKSNPNDGRSWSGLGYASLSALDLDAARMHLERAVSLMPGHVGTWHALGWTKLLQRDQPGALDAFQQALLLDRNFAESHGAVGLLLAMQGRREEAEHHLDVADRLDRANVTGGYARAVLAGEASDPQQLPQLVRRLLGRPGVMGTLSDSVEAGLRKRRR